MCAEVGEGAEHQAVLDKACGEDGAGPGVLQNDLVFVDKAALAIGRVAALMRGRVCCKFVAKPDGRDGEESRKHEENAAPAEEIAEDTARSLSEQLSGDLS